MSSAIHLDPRFLSEFDTTRLPEPKYEVDSGSTINIINVQRSKARQASVTAAFLQELSITIETEYMSKGSGSTKKGERKVS